MNDAIDDEFRRVGGPLLVGVVLLPVVFVWLLFRKGYAPSTRVAASIYAIATLAIGVIPQLMR